MTTKVTNLTYDNVQALRETGIADEVTATTATFNLDAPTALRLVETTIAGLPKGTTRQSLHSVRRKIAKAAKPANEVPARKVESYRLDGTDGDAYFTARKEMLRDLTVLLEGYMNASDADGAEVSVWDFILATYHVGEDEVVRMTENG